MPVTFLQVIAVTHSSSLEDVLNEASRKLGFVGKKIYTAQGGLIEEVCLIRYNLSKLTVNIQKLSFTAFLEYFRNIHGSRKNTYSHLL